MLFFCKFVVAISCMAKKTEQMKRITVIFAAMMCVVSAVALPVSGSQVREVLSRLDEELLVGDKYINARQARIDSLGTLMRATTDGVSQLVVSKALADEYVGFNADSALCYYDWGHDKAVAMGLDSVALAFRLQRATVLPLVGFVMEAITDYRKVDESQIPQGLKEQYYDAGRQLYSYLSSFYGRYPETSTKWADWSHQSQEKLLEYLDENSAKYRLNRGEVYLADGESLVARAVLLELLAQLSENSNMYARVSHKLSQIAKETGEVNEYVYYLALSAIADIKSATLEIMSLQELGGYMFECGDVEHAHLYLSVALDYAVRCNAMMRMAQSSQAMPLIQNAHEVELQQQQNKVYVFIAVMVMLLIGLVVALLLLRREMKRMSVLQDSLRGANQTKDVYIAQFLSLCSIYMDKLNQFSKIVNRKIAAGKVDDLFRMTKSGKFVEEQSREFYDVFDNAFLHIYPSFVEDVNALLRSDEQIVLPEGELLNTDLRILAFMRLGIEESARIAQVLNYSVNTIYTYRNKLKNKAINRENFEADIMKIESIS